MTRRISDMGMDELSKFLSEQVNSLISSSRGAEGTSEMERIAFHISSVGNLAMLSNNTNPVTILTWMFFMGVACERQGWHLNEPEPTDQSPFFGED